MHDRDQPQIRILSGAHSVTAPEDHHVNIYNDDLFTQHSEGLQQQSILHDGETYRASNLQSILHSEREHGDSQSRSPEQMARWSNTIVDNLDGSRQYGSIERINSNDREAAIS